MKRLKSLLIAGLVAGFSAVVLPLTAAPAGAQPLVTCSNYGCDGWDPSQSGCSASASTPVPARQIYDHANRHLGQIELRYSSTCRTVWARVTNYISDAGNGFITRTDGAQEACGISSWSTTMGGYSCYTPMLYDGGVTSFALGEDYDPYDGIWYTQTTGSY
jgi:hypothetical protein